MTAQRSAFGAEVVIEETSRRTPAILVVGIDQADEFAAEEEEMVEVSAYGGAGEFLYADEIGDEGLKLLQQVLAVA